MTMLMCSVDDLLITPNEWPFELVLRLRQRHPTVWKGEDSEEAAEDFFRRMLSAIAIDFETKQRMLSTLPLHHHMQADMLKKTLEEGQEKILEHLQGEPEQALQLATNNIHASFALLDLWQIGFKPHEEDLLIRQIMAKKFTTTPSSVEKLRNSRLDDFLVRRTFQPLLDIAAVYEQCRPTRNHNQ